ncbi:MAG: NAD(P)/FAD-dependent oxidoreductase [Phycisphaerae bacterium]
MDRSNFEADTIVVGAGAAGLATAIFAARRMPGRRIVALDGAEKLGAKILISGGGRCNVTNRLVLPADFWGGSANVVRRVLASFPPERTVEFFREIGVGLHEEEDGKLFPDTNSAKDVLAALLGEGARRGVELRCGRRVHAIERQGRGFWVAASGGNLTARSVVLATGGQSYPRTGSDGGGYTLAQRFGHTIVPTTPALAPLVLDGTFHTPLAGVSHEVELTVYVDGARPARIRGPMLWTHFGVSGPAAMNASRHWHRACVEGSSVRIVANLLPGDDLASAERALLARADAQPRAALRTVLHDRLPVRVADAVLARLRVPGQVPLAHLSREQRRTLLRGVLAFSLPVRGSRGYAHAEATAGGVALGEIDPRTMESRRCPGLFLAGEILDVDGRIGGFNFQWAWSSGYVAAGGVARVVSTPELCVPDGEYRTEHTGSDGTSRK